MIAVGKSPGTIYYGVDNCFRRSLPRAGCVVSDVGNRALSRDVTAAMFALFSNLKTNLKTLTLHTSTYISNSATRRPVEKV